VRTLANFLLSFVLLFNTFALGAPECRSLFASVSAPQVVFTYETPGDFSVVNYWLAEIHRSYTKSPKIFAYRESQMHPFGTEWDHSNYVVYLEGTKLESKRLVIQNGLAYLGENKERPLTTSGFQNRWRQGFRHIMSSEKSWNYVMLKDGSIYVIPDGVDIKHTSLSSAKAVAAAGRIMIEKGQVIYVDNGSGHYQLRPFFVAQFLYQLHLEGMDISHIQMDIFGPIE
jgi:hypothetical protein